MPLNKETRKFQETNETKRLIVHMRKKDTVRHEATENTTHFTTVFQLPFRQVLNLKGMKRYFLNLKKLLNRSPTSMGVLVHIYIFCLV